MAIEQEDPTEDFVMVQHDATITGMAIQTPLQDDWEVITDVETSPVPAGTITTVLKPETAMTNLSFRVWDASSRTRLVGGSFVAQTFVD